MNSHCREPRAGAGAGAGGADGREPALGLPRARGVPHLRARHLARGRRRGKPLRQRQHRGLAAAAPRQQGDQRNLLPSLSLFCSISLFSTMNNEAEWRPIFTASLFRI